MAHRVPVFQKSSEWKSTKQWRKRLFCMCVWQRRTIKYKAFGRLYCFRDRNNVNFFLLRFKILFISCRASKFIHSNLDCFFELFDIAKSSALCVWMWKREKYMRDFNWNASDELQDVWIYIKSTKHVHTWRAPTSGLMRALASIKFFSRSHIWSI